MSKKRLLVCHGRAMTLCLKSTPDFPHMKNYSLTSCGLEQPRHWKFKGDILEVRKKQF